MLNPHMTRSDADGPLLQGMGTVRSLSVRGSRKQFAADKVMGQVETVRKAAISHGATAISSQATVMVDTLGAKTAPVTIAPTRNSPRLTATGPKLTPI